MNEAVVWLWCTVLCCGAVYGESKGKRQWRKPVVVMVVRYEALR